MIEQTKEYDGMLFGNGLSINLISQLKPLIKSDKHYLFNIDSFFETFFDNKLSPKEENRIFKLFYKTKNVTNLVNYMKLKDAFIQYYKNHDANIEYWLGADLFVEIDACEYDSSAMKTFFPAIYNIWHEIMIDYLFYMNLNKKIENFNNSITSILDRDAQKFTTNFDRLFTRLKPEHLHGSFVKDFKCFDELIFTPISDESFLFKFIWGWNGIGKLILIQDITKIPGYEKYFNFDFFFNQNLFMNNLLIYGISFQISGYMKKLSASMPKYEKPVAGGIIDEHILFRLRALQNLRQLNKITFAYYSESDLQHYKNLSNHFGLHEVDYIKSSSLSFSI